MSTYDWTISQGLGGQQIQSELERHREAHEANLIKSQDNVLAKSNIVARLRTKIEQASIIKCPGVDTGSILSAASLILTDKIAKLHRAIQMKEAYRMRHGLLCEAEVSSPALGAMVMGILIFLEAALNSSFFQNAHLTASPVSALLISVLISATNIVASSCAGFFLGRWMNYGANAVDSDAPEFISHRIRARLLFILYLAVIAGFHLTVGLVRSQETLTEVHHSIGAYYTLATTPEALFLVIMGLCLSVLAYAKSKSAFDDPYPKYGAYQRTIETLQDELLDVHEDFCEQVENKFDEVIDVSEKQVKSQGKAISNYNKAFEAYLTAFRALKKQVSAAESKLRTELSQLTQTHAMASDKTALTSKVDIERLISFQKYLEIEPPERLRSPDQDDFKSKLQEQKSAVLTKLNNLFKTIVEPIEE